MLHKWQEEMTIKGDILNFHYLGYAMLMAVIFSVTYVTNIYLWGGIKLPFYLCHLVKLKFLLKARFFQKQCLGIQWSQDLMRSLQKGSLHPHGQGHCLGAPILGYIQPALIFRPWRNFRAVQIESLREPMPWPWPHLNLVYKYNGQLKLSLSGYDPC